MRLRLLAAAALCVLLAGGAVAGERIYVLSQAGAALSALEDGAEKPSFSIALDKAPAALAIGPRDGLAYVTHADLGKISVVDLDARRVVRSIDVDGSPFGIAAGRDGRLFVGDWNGAHVTVIDAAGGGRKQNVDVGRAPAHLLLSPDERLLFVANRESDSVSVVRTGDLKVEAEIAVGRAPFALALSPDGSRLYAGNVQGGTVSVVDTASLKVVETLASGAMPYGAAVTPDGSRVVVSNQQASTVSVLGQSASSAIKVGGYPEGVAISSDGGRAYVANWFSDDVSIVDLTALKEIGRIKFPGGPRSIVLAPRAP